MKIRCRSPIGNLDHDPVPRLPGLDDGGDVHVEAEAQDECKMCRHQFRQLE